MRYILILILILFTTLLTACASEAPVSKRVQTLDEAIVTLDAHVQKASMNESFCQGRGFDYYSETPISYVFRCKYHVDAHGNYLGGGFFNLVK